MAKISSAASTFTSVDAASASSNTFNPIVDDWLLGAVVVSDCIVPNPVVASSLAGYSFQRIASAVYGPDASSLYVIAAESRQRDTTGIAVSLDVSPTTATGFGFMINRVSNIQKFGAAAIRQVAVASNGTAGGAPAVTFPFAPLPGSTVIVTGASSSGSFPSPPGGAAGGWIIVSNGAYATPTTAATFSYTMGGAGQTLTSFNTCPTSWCYIGVELDVRAYTGDDVPPLVAGRGGRR